MATITLSSSQKFNTSMINRKWLVTETLNEGIIGAYSISMQLIL